MFENGFANSQALQSYSSKQLFTRKLLNELARVTCFWSPSSHYCTSTRCSTSASWCSQNSLKQVSSSRLVGLGERLYRMRTSIVTPRMSCAHRTARSFLSSRWIPWRRS